MKSLAGSHGALGSDVPSPVKEEWEQLDHVPAQPSCVLTTLDPFKDDGKRSNSFYSGVSIRKFCFSQGNFPERVKLLWDTIDEVLSTLDWVYNAGGDDPL